MDETVLRRPIGGHKVMRPQLTHLTECAERSHITIQVNPFTVGWHPALYGMFWMYRFADEQMPDIVYSEALDTMCAQAATPDQTIAILHDLMKET